jgi:hypothetical protein
MNYRLARSLWKKWSRSQHRLDVLELRPVKCNRFVLPDYVRTADAALQFALEHSRTAAVRVVLVISPVENVFIENGVVLHTHRQGAL